MYLVDMGRTVSDLGYRPYACPAGKEAGRTPGSRG